MASFLFDKYVSSVGHNETPAITVPITETSGVGICLIKREENDPELKKNDDFSVISGLIAVNELDSNAPAIAELNGQTTIKFVPVPSEYDTEGELTTRGYTMVKSHSIKFGANPAVTTINNVVGAVVFAHSGDTPPVNPSDNDSIPVCYIDFGGAVNSKNGPFKVVFKNGIPDQEDSIDDTETDLVKKYEAYGTIFIMK